MNHQEINQLIKCYDGSSTDGTEYSCYLYHRLLFRDYTDQYLKINIEQIQKSFDNGYENKYMPKSKNVLIMSNDNKYIFKIISKDEFNIFNDIAEDYVYHMTSGTSYISKILGLFKLQTKFRTKYVILMLNLSNGNNYSRSFDLKGRTPKTTTCCGCQKSHTDNINDNTYLMANTNFIFSTNTYEKIMSAINKDMLFMKNHKLMDYSLIIFDSIKQITDDGEAIYNIGTDSYIKIGIIDFFNRFTIKKKISNKIKRMRWNESQISTINHTDYNYRMKNFIQYIFMGERKQSLSF